jgi:hypothetical protein
MNAVEAAGSPGLVIHRTPFLHAEACSGLDGTAIDPDRTKCSSQRRPRNRQARIN